MTFDPLVNRVRLADDGETQGFLVSDPEPSGELQIVQVERETSKAACRRWHYTGDTSGNSSFRWGFYRGECFDGVIEFNDITMSSNLRSWAKLFGDEDRIVTELHRVALRPQSQRSDPHHKVYFNSSQSHGKDRVRGHNKLL